MLLFKSKLFICKSNSETERKTLDVKTVINVSWSVSYYKNRKSNDQFYIFKLSDTEIVNQEAKEFIFTLKSNETTYNFASSDESATERWKTLLESCTCDRQKEKKKDTTVERPKPTSNQPEEKKSTTKSPKKSERPEKKDPVKVTKQEKVTAPLEEPSNTKDVQQEIVQAATSNSDKEQSTPQQPLDTSSNDQANNSNNSSGEASQEAQNSQQSNQGNDNNDPNSNRSPPPPPPANYFQLPTFFDPPPPQQYYGCIEVQVKKEKKHPKIIRKLVPTSNSLEQKSRLFLDGFLPIEKPDFSLSAAHRKVKNIKHSIDKSGGTFRFTTDTYEKAWAKDFKNILIPTALIPSKEPAFEYQYFIEDPRTGLCVSTDEIQSIYSPEEFERLLQDLQMDKEVSFSSRITTTTTKRVKSIKEQFLKSLSS